MKKSFLFAGAAFMLILSSCNGNDNVLRQSFTTTPISIITSLTDGSTTVTTGYYRFDVEAYSQLGTLTASDIILNGSSIGFVTEELPYQSYGYDVIFKNITANATGSSSYEVKNGNFIATPYYYFPGYFGIESPYNPPLAYGIPNVLVASYQLGNDYFVKTFQANTFYKGTTTTSYTFQGNTENFKTEDIAYGLILNLKDNTATLIMYNAKFSNVPQEPVKSQINIEGLDVTFSNSGIVARGTNIIPNVVEGTHSTPYENYIFNTIEFRTTSDDLTKATISYNVAGMYYGTFTGDYADLSYIK